jgi:hypothetical protein
MKLKSFFKLLTSAALVLACCRPACAQEVDAKTVLINASVAVNAVFTTKIFKGVADDNGNLNLDWNTELSAMSFGSLTNAVASDPRSALTSRNVFMVYTVCENNSGLKYYVKYDGAPLLHTDGVTRLSNDAWVVTVGAQTGDPNFNTYNTAGLMAGRISGADTNKVLFTSAANGRTDVFRIYFSITGDPRLAVNGSSSTLIPPSQKPGTYSAAVKLTMYN